MKKYFILGVLFLMVSCTTLQLTEKTIPNCYKAYTATNKALELGYTTTVRFAENNIITLNQVEKAVNHLDQASNYVDQASALCALDIKAANKYLAKADKLIGMAGLLMSKDDKNGN